MRDANRDPTWRLFWVRFIPLGVAVLAGIILIMGQRSRALLEEIRQDQETLSALASHQIQSALGSAVADAVFLSDLMLQRRLLDLDEDAFQRNLSAQFFAFLRSRVALDQVAYLDADGMETVRVERRSGGIQRIPRDLLMDHGGQEHLTRPREAPGLTWLSPTDPVAQPDEEGAGAGIELFLTRALPESRGGFLLFRFSLRSFLEQMVEEYQSRGSRIYLARAGGEWIMGPGVFSVEEREGKEEISMAALLPSWWDRMPDEGVFDLRSEHGLAVIRRLDPAGGTDALHIAGSRSESREDWILVTLTPQSALVDPGRRGVAGIGLLILLVAAFFAWRWAVAVAREKKAHHETEERASMLDSAAKAVQDGLMVIDSHGLVTLWNPGAEAMFGYSREEMLGQDIHEVLVPERLREKARRGIREFGAVGAGPAIGKVVEMPALRQSGEEFPAELSVASFRVEEEFFYVGVVRDVSDRKAVEERLALSDRILDAIGDLVLVADSRGDIVYASPSVTTVLGYRREEILGDGWWKLTRADSEKRRAEKEATARQARGEEGVDEREYDREIRHLDGGSRWIRWRTSPGPGHTVVGVGSDVTDRKEGEEARHRLAALIRNTTDFVGYAGPDGMCQFVNPGGLRMVGLESLEEACERNLFDFIHPFYLERFRDQIMKSVMSGEVWEGEVRFVHHGGGDPVPVQGAIFPVTPRETGLPAAIGGTFKDIHARKELERELKETARRAEAANEAKQQFLANMSHEIRTPLNAILGMADLLWETELGPEQRDYVQVFRSAGDTLLSLINNVLDLAKVEEGRLELEDVGFDLWEVVENTTEVFAPAAQGKGLEILTRLGPDVPRWIRGDPGRLRQILSNLVGNAIKFTEEGEVLVEVARGSDSPPMEESGGPEKGIDRAGSLSFSVVDTGIGISREKAKEVFGRFNQADASTTRRYGGSGLGLTICESLVHLMGGEIRVVSEEGEGSTFSFSIPLRPTSPPSASSDVSADLLGVRVLVVDDNSTNRLILRETLGSWGAEVEEAPEGTTALEILRGDAESGMPVQICLLDVEMPGMDGYTLAEIIRDRLDLGRPRVVMLTSHGNSRSREELKRLNIRGHLFKPFKRPTLLHAISEALRAGVGDLREGRSSRADEDASPGAPEPAGGEEAVQGADPGGLRGVEPGEEGSDPGSGLRILVVEDSPDNRMLVGAYLKKTPHEVIFAENGQEALDRLKDGSRFDLVFMDIQMPVMDGYEATAAIRSWEVEGNRGHIPIVALSAHAMKEEIQKSMKAGCDHHLTKPIKKARLLDFINEVAQGKTGDFEE